MELLILRHGKAEDHGHPGGDGERALVEKGYKQARRAGELAKAADLLPDLVLTSPLVRARQTAETFCEAAGISAPVIQPWIACGMRADTAINELRAFDRFRRILLVGHEPDLSGLIEFLLGASGGAVDVKKGALACLDVSPSGRRGRLLFLIPPKMVE
ncbi:phosphohistidine phosphatase SixA [Luteolibacter ambystomatis]|uniref:Phosphohistidine phosphatase SixA n=1 Tax=Luteolibacter ambystomatis TaxID=2824561 RepID=A0A975G5A1_9BACT|nr:phosphohistidine phosphatase SixA [Luteolibacter ambystomatis]QUE49572.1 phosphohistidine phosphatase SixA [Luteolibacter ambystomatis]